MARKDEIERLPVPMNSMGSSNEFASIVWTKFQVRNDQEIRKFVVGNPT